MNNLNEYILEKLKINKNIKVNNLVMNFCKFTSLNYTHPDNESFFLLFEKFLKDNNISLECELDPIGNEDDVNSYFSSDKEIRDIFWIKKYVYNKIETLIKLIKPKWSYANKQEDLEINAYNTQQYGWILSYKVSDIEHPFFYIISENKE